MASPALEALSPPPLVRLGMALLMLGGLGLVADELVERRASRVIVIPGGRGGSPDQSQELPPLAGAPTMPPVDGQGGPGRAGGEPPVGPGSPPGGSGGGRVTTAAAPTESRAALDSSVCPGCDVVLITMCSLRRDHVGSYGELKPSPTPHIDAIADRGWSFSRAYAAGNFTLAGLTAVLTGRFGSSTGVITWDKGLTRDIPTLPEVMGYYGYRTGGFSTDAPSGFRPDYGLDRGFQHMELSPAPRNTPDGRWGMSGGGDKVELVEDGDGASARPAARWLSQQSSQEPVFLMFHTRTAHYPFVISDLGADEDETGMTQLLWEAGHKTHREADSEVAFPGMAGGTAIQGVVDPGGKDPIQALVDVEGSPAITVFRDHYRRAVSRMDRDIEVLVQTQEARGRLDQTIWLLVADHGESLNDHGELLHGAAFYDSVINVPLVIRVPGLAPQTSHIDSLVSHVDILPTVLELIGAVLPSGIDGASMVPLLTGESSEIRALALSEGGVALPRPDHLPGAVIALPWILLRHDGGCRVGGGNTTRRAPGMPDLCLFDVSRDPGQENVVTGEYPAVVTELVGRWDSFRRQRGHEAKQLDLAPEFVEALQRTGYDFRLGVE